jgi:arylformamidase
VQKPSPEDAQVLYDISPLLTPDLAVFPGDTPLSREVLLELARGDPVTLSTLRATVHVGSHVDAESHYGVDGRSIEAEALGRFIGPAQVITATPRADGRVGVDDLASSVAEPRVLLRTGTYPDPKEFKKDFAALDPALVDYLADRGVRLVGVDTPSVDAADSKTLPAHARCLARDVRILEGIVLSEVPDGTYELIALPLRLAGFDASPVRAILREVDGDV